METQPKPESQAPGAGEARIPITETAWFLAVDLFETPDAKAIGLHDENHLVFMSEPADILARLQTSPLYTQLRKIADYPVKTMIYGGDFNHTDDDGNHNPSKPDDTTWQTIIWNASQFTLDDRAHPILKLPKAGLAEIHAVLARHGLRGVFAPRPKPAPDLGRVLKPYPNPNRMRDPGAPETTRLETLQTRALLNGLTKRKSGVFHYAMGGGKTLLIAGCLRAFPRLRPCVVTSAASADSQQLAAKLALITGENVHLAGCASGALTAREKKQLFSKAADAGIIVGSHRLYDRLQKPAAGAAAGLVDKIKKAKLVLIDEIHECTTAAKITGLTQTSPEIALGFTATWGKNWSGTNAILHDMLNLDGGLLCDTTHAEVQQSGRVTPVTITGHTYRRSDHPAPFETSFKGFTFFQQEVECNSSRNHFLAKLLDWLMARNAAENRGAILAFAPGIKHISRITRELARLRNPGRRDVNLQDDAIYVYNAQLPETVKTGRLRALADGRIKLILATEALSRGVDINTIYDIVDLSGNSKIVQLIQKSGRGVRPLDHKTAGIHFVMEEDLPDKTGRDKVILRKISEKKRRELEHYFGQPATIVPAGQIPF